MNKCFFMGNLTRDAEVVSTTGGTSLCKFSLAINEKFKSGDKWEERVHFLDFIMWGNRASGIGPHLTKGTKVVVETRAGVNKWEKDGVRHQKVEFTVLDLQFAGGKRDAIVHNVGQSTKPAQSAQRGGTEYESYGDDQYSGGDKFEDDVPF